MLCCVQYELHRKNKGGKICPLLKLAREEDEPGERSRPGRKGRTRKLNAEASLLELEYEKQRRDLEQ